MTWTRERTQIRVAYSEMVMRKSSRTLKCSERTKLFLAQNQLGSFTKLFSIYLQLASASFVEFCHEFCSKNAPLKNVAVLRLLLKTWMKGRIFDENKQQQESRVLLHSVLRTKFCPIYFSTLIAKPCYSRMLFSSSEFVLKSEEWCINNYDKLRQKLWLHIPLQNFRIASKVGSSKENKIPK